MNGTNINNGLETSNTNNDAPNSLPEGITEEQSSSSGKIMFKRKLLLNQILLIKVLNHKRLLLPK